MLDRVRSVEGIEALGGFRREFYGCLAGRADELFELTDALLCTDGPVKTLVDLALAPEHRRGHGALYDGVNHGGIDVARLLTRNCATGLPAAPVASLTGDEGTWKADSPTVSGRYTWPGRQCYRKGPASGRRRARFRLRPSTVYGWLKAHRERGPEALRVQKPAGPAPKLTERQAV